MAVSLLLGTTSAKAVYARFIRRINNQLSLMTGENGFMMLNGCHPTYKLKLTSNSS